MAAKVHINQLFFDLMKIFVWFFGDFFFFVYFLLYCFLVWFRLGDFWFLFLFALTF